MRDATRRSSRAGASQWPPCVIEGSMSCRNTVVLPVICPRGAGTRLQLQSNNGTEGAAMEILMVGDWYVACKQLVG